MTQNLVLLWASLAWIALPLPAATGESRAPAVDVSRVAMEAGFSEDRPSLAASARSTATFLLLHGIHLVLWGVAAAATFLAVSRKRDRGLHLLGGAFLGAAIIELIQIFFLERSLPNPGEPTRSVVLFWTMGRSFSLLMLNAALGGYLWWQPRWSGHRFRISIVVLGVIGFACCATFVVIAVLGPAPVLVYERSMMPRPYEAIPIALLLTAFFLLLPAVRRRAPSPLVRALLWSLIFAAASHILLGLRSASLLDAAHVTAQGLHLLASLLPAAGALLLLSGAAASVDAVESGSGRGTDSPRDSGTGNDKFFEYSLDMLCVAGIDGYYKRVNPAFERTLGYTPEELMSRPLVEFVHPEDREATLRELERLGSGEDTVDFENRYLLKDGTYRWLAWVCPAPAPGSDLVYAIARDITDRKRAEAELEKRTSELARSNAELEQFAYAASHDLSAPLRSISQLAQWLREEIGNNLSADGKQYLELLESRTRRMQKLIADLLTYSRVGRDKEDVELVDTGKLLEEVKFLLDPPREFKISWLAKMPVLRSERTPLEHVFSNLLDNAIKHHDRQDGSVHITAKRVGSGYEFLVADDGPGIERQYREKAFQMFHTLRSRDVVEGTGLGLAMVRKIIDLQGGSVTLETSPGRGLAVRFTWPERHEETRESIEPAASPAGRR